MSGAGEGAYGQGAPAVTPRLVACYFRTNTNGDPTIWPRLSRVFRHCAVMNLPGWRLEIEELEPWPFKSSRAIPADGHNTQKLEHWARRVSEAHDGDRLLLVDADTVILRDLKDVWLREFDVAFTRRPRGYPYNAGVVFVRVSQLVRAFFEKWTEENRRMLVDRPYHATWQKRYGGLNQAALGMLLETGAAEGLRVMDLECRIWNCEDSTWQDFSSETRILHVKSALRMAVISKVYSEPGLRKLAEFWRTLEAQAKAG